MSRVAAFLLAVGTLVIALPPPAARAAPKQGAERRRSPDLAESDRLLDEAERLQKKGEYAAAIPVAARALGIRERALGKDHPEVAEMLDRLATYHQESGDYARAEPLFLRAVAIREKALGPDHDDVADAYNNLALLYRKKGELVRAKELFERSMAIYEKKHGPHDPGVATYLHNLAGTHREIGDFVTAERLFLRTMAIREQASGPEHKYLPLTISGLALLYQTMGDYPRAEALNQRGIAIKEADLGPEHPSVGVSVNNLAKVYDEKGDYARAEPLYQRALSISEKALGPEHPNVAAILNNLAALHQRRGDHERAENFGQRAVAIGEKVFGREHPELAKALQKLGDVYQSKGDYVKAEPLYRRARAILEAKLGPDHPSVAATLHSLGDMYMARGDIESAEPLYRRALAIREQKLGPGHAHVADTLGQLAALRHARGDLAGARSMLDRAIEIHEKALGAGSVHVASALRGKGRVSQDQGDHDQAERLYRRAIDVYKGAFGARHREIAVTLQDLAFLLHARSQPAKAVAAMAEAAAIQGPLTSAVLAIDSERAKIAYFAKVEESTWALVTAHLTLAPADADAERLALAAVLRSKGRVLDATSSSLRALRMRLDTADQALLEQLAEARSQFATLVLRGPETMRVERYRERLQALHTRIEDLENDASRRGGSLGRDAKDATVEDVQAALPRGAALVEFIVYRPADPAARFHERFGGPRYAAYVLGARGRARAVDLGPVAAIDDGLRAYRRALADPTSDLRPSARAVDERVMRPLRPLLGDARWLFVSPDGALNLVPFEALVDEEGRYLIDRYSFDYLTSGRDLVRFRASDTPRGPAPPIVVANPDFGPARQAHLGSPREAAGRRSADSTGMQFPPLPGTATEAGALARIFPGTRLLLGADATESAVKRLQRPRILHLATHGFFLPDQTRQPSTGARASPLPSLTSPIENPLLRSGLALSGANGRESGGEDGILTALELSGLDLAGTRLVVLSACETGLGDVKNGEGVLGLRRALLLAGAETQVMSLWAVDDIATRALMAQYYEGLKHGLGRTEALRRAQLAILDRRDTAHPYYWAAFIASGDPSSLDGAEGAPDFAVRPGLRGCACSALGERDGAPLAWPALGVLVAATVLRRRRRRCTSLHARRLM